MNKLEFIAILALGVATASSLCQQMNGTVSGRIFDQDGNPFPDFDILIDGSSPTSTYRARAKTDENGNFKVENLNLGEYVIYPYKGDAYPIEHSTFYSLHPPRVTVTADNPSVNKEIRMGPPAGSLAATVRDQRTGEYLKNAEVILCRSQEVDRSVQLLTSEKSGSITYHIPSNVPISLLVRAADHKKVQAGPIVVHPLEHKSIDISVPRLSDPSSDRSLIMGQECTF